MNNVKASFLFRNGKRDLAQSAGRRVECDEHVRDSEFDANADAYRDPNCSAYSDTDSDTVFPGRSEETVSVSVADGAAVAYAVTNNATVISSYVIIPSYVYLG